MKQKKIKKRNNNVLCNTKTELKFNQIINNNYYFQVYDPLIEALLEQIASLLNFNQLSEQKTEVLISILNGALKQIQSTQHLTTLQSLYHKALTKLTLTNDNKENLFHSIVLFFEKLQKLRTTISKKEYLYLEKSLLVSIEFYISKHTLNPSIIHQLFDIIDNQIIFAGNKIISQYTLIYLKSIQVITTEKITITDTIKQQSKLITNKLIYQLKLFNNQEKLINLVSKNNFNN